MRFAEASTAAAAADAAGGGDVRARTKQRQPYRLATGSETLRRLEGESKLS